MHNITNGLADNISVLSQSPIYSYYSRLVMDKIILTYKKKK